MAKLFKVLREEYRRHVIRKQFIGVLLFPLIILAVSGVIGVIAVTFGDNDATGPVGIVDSSQVLARSTLPAQGEITFQRFESQDTARAALEKKSLTAYAVISADFASSGTLDLYYWDKRPSRDVRRALQAVSRDLILTDVEPVVRERVVNAGAFTYMTPDRSREFSAENILSFVLPIIIGVLFVIALLFGAQYLLQAVVDEKENRTIEILITAVTPFQLMAGKILGLCAVVMTQLGVWSATAIAVYLALRDRLPFIGDLSLDPVFLAAIVLTSLLQYIVFASIMTAIGSAVTDTKQAQQWAGPFTLLAISPEFFLPALLIDPNGTIAVVLSLIPFTAPFTLALRYGVAPVPVWQMLAAIAILAGTAVLFLNLASRIFRAGTLRYGQPMPLSEIFDALRA
jgi:ABC-2 type transport system permease protein